MGKWIGNFRAALISVVDDLAFNIMTPKKNLMTILR